MKTLDDIRDMIPLHKHDSAIVLTHDGIVKDYLPDYETLPNGMPEVYMLTMSSIAVLLTSLSYSIAMKIADMANDKMKLGDRLEDMGKPKSRLEIVKKEY